MLRGDPRTACALLEYASSDLGADAAPPEGEGRMSDYSSLLGVRLLPLLNGEVAGVGDRARYTVAHPELLELVPVPRELVLHGVFLGETCN